jgi:5,6-dimethylbenzimidazole synthase
VTSATSPIFDDTFRRQLIDLFKWRRDVRSFLDKPVPQDILDKLIYLTDLAPSVGLSQPWRFIFVNDLARRAAIKANFETCNQMALAAQDKDQDTNRANIYARLKLAGLDEAPCQFAVCTEIDPAQGYGLGRVTMPEMTSYSTVMAIHTLWLAARTYGLGLGWVSILDPDAIMNILDAPKNWQLTGYFCLGYPAIISDTPELERLGWEKRASKIHVIHR